MSTSPEVAYVRVVIRQQFEAAQDDGRGADPDLPFEIANLVAMSVPRELRDGLVWEAVHRLAEDRYEQVWEQQRQDNAS